MLLRKQQSRSCDHGVGLPTMSLGYLLLPSLCLMHFRSTRGFRSGRPLLAGPFFPQLRTPPLLRCPLPCGYFRRPHSVYW
jgi:hypothetical protein